MIKNSSKFIYVVNLLLRCLFILNEIGQTFLTKNVFEQQL